MNTRKVSVPQPDRQSSRRFLLLVCGASSACVATPGGVPSAQGSSDSGSESAPTSGWDDSGSHSGSTGDSSSASGSGADSNADSGATTEIPQGDFPADLGAPLSDDPNDQIPPLDEEGCPGIYAQDILPTFELTIDPEVWEQLRWEWDNGKEQQDSGEDHNPYHPLAEFRYGEIVITDAEIRLKGNTMYWDLEDKMQFQIGFHRHGDHGHFLGQRRLAFDAATANMHMLRDRLSLAIMRDMGIAAPCANNARLVVNGEYYGLFTNLEKLDEVFLERVFDDPTGDLWDRHSWELKTNENSSNDSRLLALIEAETIEELETYLDVEQALQVFAAEAIIPNGDGPWAGGLNFFLYDDPLRNKFVLLPWDLDGTLERFNDPPDGEFPSNPDPVVWEKEKTHGRPLYELALAEPEWFAYYIDSLDQQFESGYAIDKLHARIDAWTAQIKESVFEDTSKWYTNEEYLSEVEDLHDHVQLRHEFMVEWLSCWQNGGSADDDGYCELP